MIRQVRAICVIGCAASWAPSAHAQASPGINIDVSECIELRSDVERYDCYDRLTEAALSAQPTGTATPSDQAVDARANRPPTSDTEPAGRTSEPQTPNEIRTVITELDQRRPNEYLITLKNGQVWRQSIAKRYPLRVGQDVRVYATGWGSSYRLSAIAANGFIQVERVR